MSSKAAFVLIFCLLAIRQSSTQTANAGLTPGSSVSASNDSIYDSVDVTNGSLAVHYPLLTYKLANGQTQTIVLYVDGTVSYRMGDPCYWMAGAVCHASYTVAPSYNGSRISPNDAAFVAGQLIQGTSIEVLPTPSSPPDYFKRYAQTFLHFVQEASGARHFLIPESGSNGTRSRSFDGSGYLEVLSSPNAYQNGLTGTLYDRNGNRIDPSGRYTPNGLLLGPDTSSLPADRAATAQELQLCPNLNLPNQPIAAGRMQYFAGPSDTNNGTISLLICYANINYHTNFLFRRGADVIVHETRNGTGPQDPEPIPRPVTVTYSEAAGSIYQIQSVVFPDQSYIALTYDSGATTDTIAYGNLTAMRLRTGAWIRYGISERQTCSRTPAVWNTQSGLSIAPQNGQIAQRIVDADGPLPQTWTYRYFSSPLQNTVSGPAGSSKYMLDTFSSGINGDNVCGTRVTSIEDDALDGTLVQTKTFHYATFDNPLAFGTLPELYGSQEQVAFPDQVTVSQPGKADAVTTTTYPFTFNGSQPYELGDVQGPYWTESDQFNIPYGLPQTSTFTGDDGAAGLLSKTVTTHYYWEDHPAYLQANLFELPSSLQTSGTGGNPVTTSWKYDEPVLGSPSGAYGNPTTTTTTGPQGGIRTLFMGYDSLGRITQSAEGSLTTNFAYSQAKQFFPSSVTLPSVNGVSHQKTSIWDSSTNQLLSETDENGIVTLYKYHGPLGELSSIERAVGQANAHSLTSLSHPNPNVATIHSDLTNFGDGMLAAEQDFDQLGRVSKSVSTNQSVVSYGYDAAGRILSISNPYTSSQGGGTLYHYDPSGLSGSECYADGSCRLWSKTGNAINFTDEAANRKRTTYDSLGRLVRVDQFDPSGALIGGSTTYAYDIQGNLTSVSQIGIGSESSRVRSFTYDSLSRLLTANNPETGFNTYSYSLPDGSACAAEANLPCTKTDSRNAISYSYDLLNRLTDINYSDGTPDIHNFYDAPPPWMPDLENTIGRLTNTTNDFGGSSDERATAAAFSYDPMGRLKKQWEQSPSTSPGGYFSSAQYDLAGHQIAFTYPDGRSITDSYSPLGLLSSVAPALTGAASVTPYVSAISYYPNGAINAMTYGDSINGVTETISQNTRMQPCRYVVSKGTTIYSDRQYFYGLDNTPGTQCNDVSGNNGNIWNVGDGLDGAYNQNFTYDALNRIKSWTAPNLVGAYRHLDFVYDSFGNMLQSANGSNVDVASLYNASNQLVPSSFQCTGLHGEVAGYDTTGNTVCTGQQNSDAKAFVWDAANRMSQLWSQQNNNTYTKSAVYFYNSAGERARANSYANGSVQNWREYFHFGGQVVAEKDKSNQWTDYIFANGKRVARVAPSQGSPATSVTGIHMQGNSTSTGRHGLDAFRYSLGDYGSGGGIGNYVVQTGDRLEWQQFSHNVNGGFANMYFFSCGGTYSLVDLNSINFGASPNQDTWTTRVVDLSQYVGCSVQIATFQGSLLQAGHWDLWMVGVKIRRSDGTAIAASTNLPDIIHFDSDPASSSSVSNDTATIAQAAPGGQTTIYTVTDHLGTTSMEFSDTGVLQWQGAFAPFGQELDGNPSFNRYKFTGKERDTESGLDHFQFRSYASTMGRWMSPDPAGMQAVDIRYPQTLNRYAYVNNNPLAFTDPLGLDCAYLNDSGTDLEKGGLDQQSNAGECSKNGGYWVNGGLTDYHIDSNNGVVSLTGIDNGQQTSATYKDTFVNVGYYFNSAFNTAGHIALGLGGGTMYGLGPQSGLNFTLGGLASGRIFERSVPGQIEKQVGGQLLKMVRVPVTGMQADVIQQRIQGDQTIPPDYAIYGPRPSCDCATWAQQVLGDAGINTGPVEPRPASFINQLDLITPRVP